MKYFACQPDSHNGFGLLIGHTLTYFEVENAGRKDAGPTTATSTAAAAAVGSSSNPAAIDGDEATRVRVQCTLTLPHDFGKAPHCFGMANRSMYGFDMAFVGASTGVMAVVVMPTRSVIYAPGRTLASLRTLSTPPTDASVAANASAAKQCNVPFVVPHSPGSPVETLRSPKSLAAQPGLEHGVGTITWMRDKPLVFVGFMSGRVEWYSVTISAAKQQEYASKGSRVVGEDAARRPNVAEGPNCGASPRVVETTAAGVASIEGLGSAGTFAPSTLQRNSSQWLGTGQQAYEDGDGDGIRVHLHFSCSFPDTGAFLTSDWFAATGYIVGGAERAVYVFSTEQPGCPLHCVPRVGCSFLACHPFLPIVGCLAFGRSAEAETTPDACVLYVLEWAPGRTLRHAAPRRTLEATPRQGVYYSCSWKFSSDLQVAVCNLVEGAVHVLHLSPSEEGLDATPVGTAQAATTAAAAAPFLPPSPFLSPQHFYAFTRERQLHLPLHSLVNVEFVSAATHALSELTPPLPPSATSSLASRRSRHSLVPRENMLAARMLNLTGARNRDHRASLSKTAMNMTAKTRKTSTRTKNEIDDVDICAAASGGDLVKPGPGAFSRLVGVNYAGELASIPVDADATLTILSPDCCAIGLCASVFAACSDGAAASSSPAEIDMEQRMKRRLETGFGIPTDANVQALRELNDPSETDLRVLFGYIAIMEKVGVVGSSGPVPSVIDLLSLPNAPSTTQLMDMKLLPHNAAVVCRSSTSRNDSRRLLLLHLLDWIPSQESSSRGDGTAKCCMHTNRETAERAVAVEVLHNRRPRAAAVLLQHQKHNPTYAAMAGFLEHYDSTANVLRGTVSEVRDRFLRQLSPWLLVAFLHEQDREQIYVNTALPLLDRVAIAVLLEPDTSRLVSLLRGTFARECTMVQRLLLLEGIRESTCPLMQGIVDCTGDFQLAACLFARIGAPAAAAQGLNVAHSMGAAVPRDTLGGGGDAGKSNNNTSNENTHASHPWQLWAAAYCTFLNNEQEFVKRTMFDLACQQLRGLHATSSTVSHSQQQQERERVFISCSRPSNVAQSTSGHGSQCDAPEPYLLSQLILSGGQRRCSICSDVVYVRRQCARDSFAWCTACLHGGHANHLQEWFATHRKCPVYDCSCRCEQGGGVP
ncbi:hypothetical protein DQ04_03321010 [Trypanosoma grayi]|uniref:hypothetical protein n=1 Tax=Trypanosoma grayi TaxID=71804 RepID=UPI0004F42A91|nr:hypothetical protein DQ04_03321010 [Trypanosoma grayi]KEG10761.1 hypothetical protein DQ04_03321010 [Trypanosoma grayi]